MGIVCTPPPGGQRVVNIIGVDDIDDAIRRAKEAGAVTVSEKQPISGMGWAAYLTDPTGIVFGVFMNDPTAG